jgi:tetraacyldisaccharide 4'-kinase
MMTTPLSLVYSGLLKVRAAWWRHYSQVARLPVVSVGNLTVGGNGKTPFALFLARRLRECGLGAGIVSRGYGGRSRAARLVSDHRRILMTPRQAGDEPVMMAKWFDGPVAIARRRIDAIKLLAANRLAEVVVLDDAFQHVRLRRQCDLVLFNQNVGLGNGRLLPAGPLREPLTALERADAIVFVQCLGLGSSSNAVEPEIARHKIALQARLEPASLTYSDKGDWQQMPLMLKGRRVAAVSGLANPSGFRAMLHTLGASIVAALDYPDHHEYKPRDWKKIEALARDAEMIITTEKDLVKLEHLAPSQFPLFALHLKVLMEPPDENQLLALVLERLRRAGLTLIHQAEAEGGTVSGPESGLARHTCMPEVQR